MTSSVARVLASRGALATLAAGLGHPPLTFCEQLANAIDELVVVPGFFEIVRGAFADQENGVLDGRPGRQQENRQIGVDLSQSSKESGSLFAGRRSRSEVHVLKHDTDRLRLDDSKSLLRRARDEAGQLV